MDGPCAGAACGGGCWYCGGGCWYCCCASRSEMRWSWSASEYACCSRRRPAARPAAYAPPPTTAARINGRRLIMTFLLRRRADLFSVPVNPVGQGDAEGHPELRRDGLQHAEEILGRTPGPQRVGHLPEVRGRGRVERDQRRDLDERERAPVQAARLLPLGPGLQAREQQFRVAQGQSGQGLPGGDIDIDLAGHSHGADPLGRFAG